MKLRAAARRPLRGAQRPVNVALKHHQDLKSQKDSQNVKGFKRIGSISKVLENRQDLKVFRRIGRIPNLLEDR